jgi:hypothetical protein
MDTGQRIYEGLPFPGINRVYHDPEHPSYLVLPVIPDAPIIKPVGPSVSDIKWPLQQSKDEKRQAKKA